MTHRSGFIAIAGCPNVGKSSLLNRVLGKKISITSRKADTTRYCIQGIVTTPEWQISVIDTPGYTPTPRNALQLSMQKSMRTAFSEADLILWLTDIRTIYDEASLSITRFFPPMKPVVLLVNKVDLAHSPLELHQRMNDLVSKHHLFSCVAFSALTMTPEGFIAMVQPWLSCFPEHPPFYESDALTDRSTRFLVAEFIREKLHRLLGQELPYRIAVNLDRFQREGNHVMIDATIWVSKTSHRAMVLGQQGLHIKRISVAAREDIERLLEAKVMLRLWVKVKAHWMDNERDVSHLYSLLT